jgi:hyperosmotically inducible protein
MQRLFLLSLMSASIFTSGCLPVVLGGVAAAGYISSQERGVKAAVSDLTIKTHIKDKLTAQHYQYLTQVEVSVLKGGVLLTGVVENSKAAVEVESVVQSVEGVKEVYNELFTDGYYPAKQYTEDAWISTQVKSLMFANENIKSVNYNIHVVNGHVYVFGFARSTSEIETIKHLLRTTKGVKQVHNYIKVYNSN